MFRRVLLVLIVATFCSCDNLRNESRRAVSDAQEKIDEIKGAAGNKKRDLVGRAIPQYDAFKADTKANRRRLKEHLGVGPAADVQNIYAYGDFLGIDYKVLISFNCDPSTLKKIVQANDMSLSTLEKDEGLHFQEEFPWWDKEMIESLRPYKAGTENEFWKYLWYDTVSRKAYYEEFTL